MTTTLLLRRPLAPPRPARPAGIAPLLASEAFAAAVGFGVLVVMARTLGPREFASVESATAVVAVLLVLVRSGVESIVIREASRRPRLIAPLTETLIGLKLACAGVAYLGLAALAIACRGPSIALVAGVVLFPSAMVADVGPRALGRLGPIAIAQALRALGLLAATLLLVRSPADATAAAGCVAIAESLAAIVLGVVHRRIFGVPIPRFRRRAWCVLGRRGLVASLSRLGRVILYGADLMALSAIAPKDLGPYAAPRRVAFAMIGLGLVVPAAFAPSIASAWARGVEPARRAIRACAFRLMNLSVAAAIGLAMTAEGWAVALFGTAYRGSGLALALVAGRAPFLLLASLHQSSLVAIRREAASLRVVAGMMAVAAAVVPLAAWSRGPIGAAAAMIGVEALGMAAGWRGLREHHIAPPVLPVQRRAICGMIAMIAAVFLLRDRPVWVSSLAGAAAFGAAWIAPSWRVRT